MIALITEMNNDAGEADKLFKATFENVQNAYEKSKKSDDKNHQLVQ
jgi:hypothetical protein